MHRILFVVLLGLAGTALAVDRPESVFSRLDRLERESFAAREQAEEQTRQLASLDESIREMATQRDLAARASKAIQSRVVKTMARWHSALSSTVQDDASWKARDTQTLLRYSASSAIRPNLEDLHVLQKVDVQSAELNGLVTTQAQQSVILAQHKATGDLRAEERAAELRKAKTDPRVKEDLKATDTQLHGAMLKMLKYETERDFHRLKGTLLPPVPGTPSFLFGVRATVAADVTIRHTGWTYRSPKGTPVRATADGLVVFAHTFEGYGQLVIIDHGGGYHSLYAHMDRVLVKTGAKVERNTQLGESGESGSLEGPKFYFELRHQGQAIDPRSWFVTR